MTSGFNSHLSCTPKWSKRFETNTAGQQIFSEIERPFLGAIFTNGTIALAGKGLRNTLMQFSLHDRIEGSALPVTRVASANQNVTINILREKSEESPKCLPRKPGHINGAKDWWIPNKVFKVTNGATV